MSSPAAEVDARATTTADAAPSGFPPGFAASKDSGPNRLLFASCNSHHYEQDMWTHVRSRDASAFIWAGDAIYADEVVSSGPWPFVSKSIVEAKPDTLRQLYQLQLHDRGYRSLFQPSTPTTTTGDNVRNTSTIASLSPLTVLGTVDDHDYGINNGDRTYPYRTESAIAYVDFLKQSNLNNPRANLTLMDQRARNGKGVYAVKVFDFTRPRGEELLSDDEAGLDPDGTMNPSPPALSSRSVAVFLLDCRSNKSPWKTGPTWFDRITPDYDGDFLGSDQWEWFEEGLRRSTAAVNVVVQGLQVHPDRFFDGNTVEDWSRFPMAQHRLYQALLQPNVQAPILVSGDVHMAELLRKDCRQHGTAMHSPPTRMLLEVTTSGLTHSWGTSVCARPGDSLPCRSPYFNFALRAGMHLAHINQAWTDLVDVGRLRQEGAKGHMQYSLERNFGEFEFNWDERQVTIRILGAEPTQPPLLSTRWDFDLLSGKLPTPETGQVNAANYEAVHESLSMHGAADHDWVCLNYRGQPSALLKAFGVLSPVLLSVLILILPLTIPAVLTLVMRRPRSSCKHKKV